jgi:hypothetical protein
MSDVNTEKKSLPKNAKVRAIKSQEIVSEGGKKRSSHGRWIRM